MHSNSNGTTGFLEKMSFIDKLGKSGVLSMHNQLLFFLSGRFPGNMNWTGAQ